MDNDTLIQHLREAIALIERAIDAVESGADPAHLLANAIGHLERALDDEPGTRLDPVVPL